MGINLMALEIREYVRMVIVYHSARHSIKNTLSHLKLRLSSQQQKPEREKIGLPLLLILK